jgi:CYTH domain-containing protein/thymidylate kinase
MAEHIPTIVLTGGAGSGKSTSLSIVRQKLEELGWGVVTVPEAATDLMNNGITPAALGAEEFQRQLVLHILARERLHMASLEAMPVEKKVLILDRSVQDSAAYMGETQWRALESSFGYDPNYFRDCWCDGVILLRSPAFDKPEAYTTANNPMRRETLEEARDLDQRTLAAWVGAPHMTIIGNKEGDAYLDMQDKALRAIQAACRVLGIPVPLEIERKYKIESFDFSDLPSHRQDIDIVQWYLQCAEPDFSERVRKRGQNGFWTYYHTLKKRVGSGVRTEAEHMIGREEFELLRKRSDPGYKPVRKTRTCFVYDNQYCELDTFQDEQLALLEIELTDEQQAVRLPPFLNGLQDVTDNEYYSNMYIARRLATRSSCCG